MFSASSACAVLPLLASRPEPRDVGFVGVARHSHEYGSQTASSRTRQRLPVARNFWILPIVRPISVSGIVRIVWHVKRESRREPWHVLENGMRRPARSRDGDGERMCRDASRGLRRGHGRWRLRHRRLWWLRKLRPGWPLRWAGHGTFELGAHLRFRLWRSLLGRMDQSSADVLRSLRPAGELDRRRCLRRFVLASLPRTAESVGLPLRVRGLRLGLFKLLDLRVGWDGLRVDGL